jgi:UDP-N-acetylmuramoylalanine--D-glutamate ligase
MTTLFQNLATKYKDKEILILGFGREGKSTAALLRQIFPEKEIFVSDEKKVDDQLLADLHLTNDSSYLTKLTEYDVVFKTPGISTENPAIQNYIQSGKILTSQLNEFLELYKQQTIGVTGTKGKSTTASLIDHILRTGNIPSILAGNIGIPVFDIAEKITPETKVVIEMSSYQLETVTNSPHIAIFLNLFSEHLNYHQSIENYLEAKSHITSFQTAADIFIYNADFPEAVSLAKKTKAQTRPFSSVIPSDVTIDPLFVHLSPIVLKNNLPPAMIAAEICCVDTKVVEDALLTFSPLPHRLEQVGSYKGFTFIDDTLATIPEATCAAIDAVSPIKVIILGGYDRGIEYTKVVEKVMEKKIPFVIFFKPSGEKMYQVMKLKYPPETHPKVFFVETMEEAIHLVYHEVKEPGTVLLSPASPSFGQFKDYEDKSQQFARFAKELAPN